jgi:hypothetical protein
MRASHGKPADKQPKSIDKIAHGATHFQRREWIVQRIGWSLMGLVILAALAGVFGRGPLANATVGNDVVTLKFERFVRRSADARWDFIVHDDAVGRVDIGIDANLGSHFEISAIHPEPSSTALSGGKWIYSFDTRGGGDLSVQFVVLPQEMGRHSGTITVNESPPLQVSLLVYP